jgi:hypothetical protein
MLKTVGISPKVTIPSVALILVGATLTIIGLLAANDTISTAGISVLGAAGIHLPLAYKADAGAIIHALDEPGNDQLLGNALNAVQDIASTITAPSA